MAERGAPLSPSEPGVCELVLPIIVFELSDDDFLGNEEQTSWEENSLCLTPGDAEIEEGKGAKGVNEDRLIEDAGEQATPLKFTKNEGCNEEVPNACEDLKAVSLENAVDHSEPDQDRVLGSLADPERQNKTEKEDGEISDTKSNVTDSVIRIAATVSQEREPVANGFVQESLPELLSVDPDRNVNCKGPGPLETGYNKTSKSPKKSSKLNEKSDKSEECPNVADQDEQSASPVINGDCHPGDLMRDDCTSPEPDVAGTLVPCAKRADCWKCSLCGFECTSSARLRKHVCTRHNAKNSRKVIQRPPFVSSESCHKFAKKRKAPKKGRRGRNNPGEDRRDRDKPEVEKKEKNTNEKFFRKTKASEPSESFRCKICTFVFSEPKAFSQHVKEHNNGPPYLCPQCDYASEFQSCFLTHLYWHAGHELYQCNFCAFLSLYSNSMVKHSYLHTGAKPYSCATCQLGFTSASGLKRHTGAHCRGQKSSGSLHIAREKDPCPPQTYVCDECNVVFYTQTLLRSHKKCHGQEKGHEAPSINGKECETQEAACEQAAGSREGKMNSPNNSARGNSDCFRRMYHCDGCSLAFQKEEHLVYHQAVHAQVQPGEKVTCDDQPPGGGTGSPEAQPASGLALKRFKCLQCAYTTSSFYNLRVHFVTHTGERPFKCQECGKSFRNSSHLKRHASLHVQNRHRCSWCLFAGSSAEDLQLHEETCKDKGPGGKRLQPSAVKCERSEEQTDRAETNRSTPSWERGARSYKCEHCAYSTYALDNLKIHTRVHTGEKPYACDVCQKTFRTSSHLRRHALVHQERKFNCGSCDYSASSWQSFKQHMASHGEAHLPHSSQSQKKPPSPVEIHKCEKCSYSTVAKGNLNVHFRIHTGERPYKCPHCSHAFRTPGHLKKHLPTHLKLQCGKCGFSTLDEHALHKHAQTHKKKKARSADQEHSTLKKKVYKCNKCRLTFSVLRLFNAHKKKHRGSRKVE